MSDELEAVRKALEAAGLEVSDAELEPLTGTYRTLREHVRSLDIADAEGYEPADVFRADRP
jgi:hypothetical protein